MISICIPTYNYKIAPLILDLERQMEVLNVGIELVVIDDDSDEVFKIENRSFLKKHNYIELSKNIGRSKIRNQFLLNTQYNFLLFLDCDVGVIKDDFLQEYVKTITSSSNDVVCGGLAYSDKKPKKNKKVRWEFGHKRECKSASARNTNPYSSFMTSNFLIKRKLLENNPFNEKLTKYGHEDTLLGFQLKLAQRKFLHIDNPVEHLDVDSNIKFVEKTQIAVQNLWKIYSEVEQKQEFTQNVTLLKYFKCIKCYKLNRLLTLMFRITKGGVFFLLKKGITFNLRLLDFYKLGVLSTYASQKQH